MFMYNDPLNSIFDVSKQSYPKIPQGWVIWRSRVSMLINVPSSFIAFVLFTLCQNIKAHFSAQVFIQDYSLPACAQ